MSLKQKVQVDITSKTKKLMGVKSVKISLDNKSIDDAYDIVENALNSSQKILSSMLKKAVQVYIADLTSKLPDELKSTNEYREFVDAADTISEFAINDWNESDISTVLTNGLDQFYLDETS